MRVHIGKESILDSMKCINGIEICFKNRKTG